jgi:hypothetical protein
MPGSSPEDTQVSDAIDTSTVIDAQASDSGSNDQGGDVAASPPAAAVTMLDAVQTALAPKEASPASQEPGPDANADPDAKAAEGEESDELSADELKALNWKTQQRFKKAYSTVKAKDGEIAELKPKAVEYDRMVGAIQRAGVAPAELDELVEIGGLLKSNQRAAYEKLMPIVRALESSIGEVLPPDLAEKVRLGYITEDDARDLNRSKADARFATHRLEQSAAQQKQEQEAAAFTKLTTQSISAVERWDAQQASKDPDWHLKQREVAEQVELAITREANKRREPYFPTADEAVKLAKDALETVEKRMKRFAPKPTEIRAATPGASNRSKPAPKTMLDAVNNALG